MTKTILVDCAAPIPVGHRVEVRVLKEPEAGFLSRRSGSKHQINQPWVKDLDTGVEYTVYWHNSNFGSIMGAPGQDFGATLRSDLETVSTHTGVVTACQVLTISGSENWRLQTRLVINTA